MEGSALLTNSGNEIFDLENIWGSLGWNEPQYERSLKEEEEIQCTMIKKSWWNV